MKKMPTLTLLLIKLFIIKENPERFPFKLVPLTCTYTFLIYIFVFWVIFKPLGILLCSINIIATFIVYLRFLLRSFQPHFVISMIAI